MNQAVFPPVLIGDPDLTPCELAAKQTSWGSKFKNFFKQAITVHADWILTHPADSKLTQGGLLVFRLAIVDKCTQFFVFNLSFLS